MNDDQTGIADINKCTNLLLKLAEGFLFKLEYIINYKIQQVYSTNSHIVLLIFIFIEIINNDDYKYL